MNFVDYKYVATIVNVVDGDTIDVRLDLGFRIFIDQRVRLYGVNTPERGQPGYNEAKKFVSKYVGTKVGIVSYKAEEKYGRWLAAVYTPDGELSDMLIAGQFGVEYFGGKRV